MSYGFGNPDRRQLGHQMLKEKADGRTLVKGRLEHVEKIHRIFQGGRAAEGGEMEGGEDGAGTVRSRCEKGREGAGG